ncbi:hypothetical protein BBJ29_009004 [Phytophthora kernoviae]|uniref:Uncharacterized protein n=1 Tax=Phytophthora kernoviae TaxID=325452 RepID=A0A3F2REW3_9STRA|nr:hypothetical protein BBP00_00008623 [Phytophthora kernoviae]RLN64365.1 hypothetical protein BBJ29_009004 [Phytophthora kernoviae]
MQTNSMQTCTQIAVLEHNEAFDEKPEREDVDMEVELGVNLIDTFSKKHQGQAGTGRWHRDSEQRNLWSVKLDDVTQEVLSTALLETQDFFSGTADVIVLERLDWNDPGAGIKQKMVEFLYAFEKFRIVYGDSYET